MPSAKPKSYIRDDGVRMVEIRPNEYVEESIAERLRLTRHASGGIVGPGKPYIVGESASDYPVSKALAERLGLLR